MRQLMFALAITAWPAAAVGQTAADTVTLTVLVQGSNRVYGQQVSRAKTGTGFATASIRAELLPVNGVAVWMPYGCKALR